MSAPPADHSALYGYVAIFITASLVILLLPAVFFFKVDLVLGYRTLTAHFYKKGDMFTVLLTFSAAVRLFCIYFY